MKSLLFIISQTISNLLCKYVFGDVELWKSLSLLICCDVLDLTIVGYRC